MPKLVLASISFLLTLVYSSCHAQLSLTVTTPTPTEEFATWISLVATSLLPDNTPGFFWGAVDAQDVESACKLIEGGQLSFQTTITAYGETSDRQFQLVATGGCDASQASPAGVEMVFTDDAGRTNALICDGNAWTAGCAIYNTGEDVNSIYNQATYILGNDGSTFLHEKDVLPCQLIGAVVATGAGLYTALSVCPAFGPLALLCLPAVVFVAAWKGSIIGDDACQVISQAQCFPGDAIVFTSTGQNKYMSELSVGDEVAVLGDNQKVQFESIYAFGHADNMSVGSYIRLQLEPSSQEEFQGFVFPKMLYITPLHFSPIISATRTKMIYKRAKDINIGDLMLITDDMTKVITHARVTGKSKTFKKGLYNPFTMGGTIIVDGVIASTHSEWFLDVVLDSLSLTRYTPMVYQVMMYPIRKLYHILGRDYYVLLYRYVDNLCDIPRTGTNHGWKILQILVTSTTFVLVMTIRRNFKKATLPSKTSKQARVTDHVSG